LEATNQNRSVVAFQHLCRRQCQCRRRDLLCRARVTPGRGRRGVTARNPATRPARIEAPRTDGLRPRSGRCCLRMPHTIDSQMGCGYLSAATAEAALLLWRVRSALVRWCSAFSGRVKATAKEIPICGTLTSTPARRAGWLWPVLRSVVAMLTSMGHGLPCVVHSHPRPRLSLLMSGRLCGRAMGTWKEG